MCMRKTVLNIGEKIFNFVVVIALILGVVSAVNTALITSMDGSKKDAIIGAVVQLLLSWSITLVVSLVVYSLLEIAHSLKNKN